MKNMFFAALFMGLFSITNVFAQEVSNDDLYRYAIVMETVSLFQNELSAQITEYVEQQDPAIKNRYNALAGGETPANDAEKKFIDQVNSMKNDRSSEFNDAFKSMVKRVLGAKTYSEVKKAIASDSGVKERYNAMVQEIKSAKGDASASSGK